MNSKTVFRRVKNRKMYDQNFKNAVVRYALRTSNRAASTHFGINESNVRRWKRMTARGEFLEMGHHAAALQFLPKRRRGRPRKKIDRMISRYAAAASRADDTDDDLDSMPLMQRLNALPSKSPADESSKRTLKSEPLSPTKLKVTRHSAPEPPEQPVEDAPSNPQQSSQEICLRWNNHHSNMQSAFPTLLSKEQFCDVTLVADGKSLKCHKLILSSCSAYFDQVLEKIMPYQHPVIFMKDIPFNILKSLCDFMYAGEVNIEQNDLVQILSVAESLKIKGLANNKIYSHWAGATTTVENGNNQPSTNKEDTTQEDITNPCDLLQKTHEEIIEDPSPRKQEVHHRRTMSKRTRKRRYFDEENDPPSPPPMLKSRKGTRTRPNIKMPKFYDNYIDKTSNDTAQENEEPAPSTHLEIAVEEIKSEPVDIDDEILSYTENFEGCSNDGEQGDEQETTKTKEAPDPVEPQDDTTVKEKSPSDEKQSSPQEEQSTQEEGTKENNA